MLLLSRITVYDEGDDANDGTLKIVLPVLGRIPTIFGSTQRVNHRHRRSHSVAHRYLSIDAPRLVVRSFRSFSYAGVRDATRGVLLSYRVHTRLPVYEKRENVVRNEHHENNGGKFRIVRTFSVRASDLPARGMVSTTMGRSLHLEIRYHRIYHFTARWTTR